MSFKDVSYKAHRIEYIFLHFKANIYLETLHFETKNRVGLLFEKMHVSEYLKQYKSSSGNQVRLQSLLLLN